MKQVLDFPDREAIEQQAAEWLIRLDGDEPLTTKEISALREWMHRSPTHKAELNSFDEFWSNQSLVALPISLEDLYESQPALSSSTSRWSTALFGRPGFSALAAIALVGLLIIFPLTDNITNNGLYAAAVGEQRQLELPDGSVIYLNTNSQVQIDYTDTTRNIVLLQGEAHFDVAKNPQRPFNVYAGGGLVQAVGTAFTVFFKEDQDIDVTVTEGKVALSSLAIRQGQLQVATTASTATRAAPKQQQAGNTSPSVKPTSKEPEANPNTNHALAYYATIPVDKLGELEAGQVTTLVVAQQPQAQSTYKLDQIKTIAQDELERRGAWRSGLLIFTGNSLEEVVAEISRYTTLNIEIVDPELKKIRIGGQFSVDGSTSALFDALEANFGLTITQLDYNRVKISAAKKNKIN